MQQFETSPNHALLTSLPPEIHHSILSYMDNWREKVHYCTHVSKLIFSPMVHDEHSSLGMFRVLCCDLKELELENLFELCFEKVRLYSNCNFRKLVLEWIKFSTRLFPELVEKKKEKIVDYWNKSIEIYKNSFAEEWPYEWTLKEKNILNELNSKRCVAKKERNWKETLRGIIYEKKTFELNIIIDGLSKKGAFGKKAMCYFSKLVDLLKFINVKRRKQIISQLYSGDRYCFLGSVVSSFQKYSPKKEDIDEIIVPFISYYLEERYQHSLNYEFMASPQNFVALLTMIKMGCIDSVTDLLTNKISNFEPTNARKLFVAFMKALVPIEKIKQCLIDTRIITSSVILSRDSMDKTIPLQICIINAKKLYIDWEYFTDLVDLVSEIIQQDCNNEEIGMSYKTIMLQIFGRKTPTYSAVDFLSETITKSENPTSNKRKFLDYVSRKVGVSIVPRYANLAEYYARRTL